MRQPIKCERRARRGAVLLWTVIIIPLMLAMASLAVDFGRVALVRAELQHAVDTAAREGAWKLPAGLAEVRSAAIVAAEQNKALGAAVQIQPTDVLVVSRDGASNNAVRVQAGLEVPLLFGLADFTHASIGVFATARRNSGGPGFGIIGLEGITMTGSSYVDGYDSSVGPYNSSKGASAHIASNGNISLGGASQLQGDASSHNGTIASAAKVSGGTHSLDTPLEIPPEPATTTSPGGDWSTSYGPLPAGDYYFRDLDLKPPHTLRTTGPVTIYVERDVSIKGSLLPQGNLPANLRIVVLSNRDVQFTATAQAYAQLVAPNSHVTFTGNSTFHGSAIGRTVMLTGNSDVHHDTSLPTPGGAAGGVVLIE